MGNEDKISRQEIVKRGSAFLPEEIRDLEGQGEVYSLEDEFAKTKKNKNYRLVLFVLGFIAVTVGLTYLYSIYLTSESRNIRINIQEFEDLRLKEFLQAARHDESNVDILRMKIQIIRVEMLSAMLDVRRDYLSKQFDVAESSMSQEEKTRRSAELKTQEEKRIRAVQAGYRAQIAQKRSEMWAMEERLNKERSALKGSTKSEFITNEDRVYKMRMKKMRETQQSGLEAIKAYYDNYMKYLVLKYNPVFRSSRLTSVIGEGKSAPAELELKEFNAALGREAGFDQEKFSRLRENINGDLMVVNRLMNVPYINSVAPALKSVDYLTRSIIMDYESIWTRLLGALNSRNAQLRGVYYAFSQKMEDVSDDERAQTGFVLDPRNDRSVIIYMLDEKAVKSGDAALVLRGRDEYLGTIELYRSAGLVRGRVIEKKEDFRPFDKLVRVSAQRKEQNKEQK
ncbi:MAG: hypothetical protein JXA20_15775 [Spirochaetes bacterium]|nr:hypothetical protein [Spirochaetota bacterium]